MEILSDPTPDMLAMPRFDDGAIDMQELLRRLAEQVVNAVMDAEADQLCGGGANSRSFATEVARDGVLLYGTVGGGKNKDKGTLMEFGLANGTAITSEDIKRECAEYESGSWAGTLTGLRVGRSELSDGETDAILSFKCPKTDAVLIERAAAACGMQKSEFLRSAAIEMAEKILGSA